MGRETENDRLIKNTEKEFGVKLALPGRCGPREAIPVGKLDGDGWFACEDDVYVKDPLMKEDIHGNRTKSYALVGVTNFCWVASTLFLGSAFNAHPVLGIMTLLAAGFFVFMAVRQCMHMRFGN